MMVLKKLMIIFGGIVGFETFKFGHNQIPNDLQTCGSNRRARQQGLQYGRRQNQTEVFQLKMIGGQDKS